MPRGHWERGKNFQALPFFPAYTLTLPISQDRGRKCPDAPHTHTPEDTHSRVRKLCLVDTKFSGKFYLSGLTVVCGCVWVWGVIHCVGETGIKPLCR